MSPTGLTTKSDHGHAGRALQASGQEWDLVPSAVRFHSTARNGATSGRPRTCRRCFGMRLRSLIDHALDLAAVDVQLSGYGPLAVTGGVPGPYRLLQAWRFCWGGWRVVVCDRYGLALGQGTAQWGGRPVLGPDQGHE